MIEREGNESVDPFDGKTARFEGLSFLDNYTLEKKVAVLVVLSGTDAGLRIPLLKPTILLGRTIESDIVLHDELISRRHARVTSDAQTGEYRISDLKSTNGTRVNNREIDEVELSDGDKIFLGTTVMKFVLEDDLESESYDRVDQMLFRDELTGLVVPRRFYSELRIQLRAAAASNVELALLMMDLDGLKGVNDRYGHPVGAFVISEAGREIGQVCKARGQACRYGGDEFVAYLARTSKTDALEVGERIRLAIVERTFDKDGNSHRVSISIGVAAYPGDGRSLEEMVKAADDALYRAKEKGRNCVSV